jgi:DNA repair exonuclease SbcCD nuclease subunit
VKIYKSKVCIISDLHLGIYGNSEDWHDIAIKWAEWLSGELNRSKVRDILFLGDFFHNRSEISVKTLHVASILIDILQKFNIILLVGNHDCLYKNRSDVHSLGLLKGHNNLTIIDKPLEFEAFGKNMAFIPWESSIPNGKFDYIFGHFEIISFKMNNFKVCDHGHDPMDFLASKTSTVFSGHFHNRHSKKYNEGSIHYVGNTFPMDFSDVGNERGYHILDVESGDLEFFANPISPKFVKILLSKNEYPSDDLIKGNIVKLIIDKEIKDDTLEKIKANILALSPHQLTTEFNVTSKSIDSVEQVDSIDLTEMFEEFQEQLKLDDDKDLRVREILKGLYDRNK